MINLRIGSKRRTLLVYFLTNERTRILAPFYLESFKDFFKPNQIIKCMLLWK